MGTIGHSFDPINPGIESPLKRKKLTGDMEEGDIKRQKISQDAYVQTSSQQVAKRIQVFKFPGEELTRGTKFLDRVHVLSNEGWFSLFSVSPIKTCGRLARR